jgi:predicted amidohydrolase
MFDTADARIHHSFPVIKAALADGFYPDVISTDITRASLFGNMVFGLPAVMSKYLSLGLGLEDVIKACTATPAGLIGMSGKLGTLAPGAFADVAIFELTGKSFLFKNRLGETFEGTKLLIPKMTILNGKIMFKQIDF